MNNTPANSLRDSSFCTLAGVESAALVGGQVTGIFAKSLRWFPGKRLCEEFANWPNKSADVLRFTRRFGPLEQGAKAGGEFRFSTEAWNESQEGFRLLWAVLQSGPPIESAWGNMHVGGGFEEVIHFDGEGGFLLVPHTGDRWRYGKGKLFYAMGNLLRLLIIELLSIPRERLKMCARPDCTHPHFVARHLKQNYCSEVCAAWGQGQWKRRWWAEHGKGWRENHRKEARMAGERKRSSTRKEK